METNRLSLFSSSYLMILVSSLFLSPGLSVSFFISDDIFVSQGSSGRNLLQAKKDCPVDFENQNYTILTSQCKGPQYPPKPCCDAFKEFACPHANVLNDPSNTCVETMFSYLEIIGKYPGDLFASLCDAGTDGIECPALPPSEPADANGSGVLNIPIPFTLLLLLKSAFLAWMF